MNPLRWSFRTAFAVAAAVCAAFLGFAYYAQFQMHLDPCPLCIFQRIAFIAFGVVCLAAALHGPKGYGRRIYGTFALLAAGVGAAIAGRHVWLQHLPADKVPDGGPGLDWMLETLPVGAILRKVFTGSGECAKVDWTFLSLSMPEWTLIWFVVFLAGAAWFGFRRA